MMIARFKNGFKDCNPVEIILLISLENERQTGEKLKAFFSLVARLNADQRQICVNILISDYLNRHYKGESASLLLSQQWEKANEVHLNFEQIKCRKTYWRELTGDEPWKALNTLQPEVLEDPQKIISTCEKLEKSQLTEFQKKLIKVVRLFGDSEEFRVGVNQLSRSHASKMNIQSARLYILEECAVMFMLQGQLCYPAEELNIALSFTVKYFNLPITYCSYSIHPIKQTAILKQRNKHDHKSSTEKVEVEECNEDILLACLGITKLMETHGIFGIKQQMDYFRRCLLLKKDDQFESAASFHLSLSNSEEN